MADRSGRTVRSGGSRRRRLTLAAAGVLAAVLLVEVGVRLLAPQLHDAAQLHERQRIGSIAHLRRFSADPLLHYELVPGLRGKCGEAIAVIDEQGCRIGEETVTAEPADAPRIAVVGDSTSFGWKVAFEESYPARVRRELAAWRGRPVVLGNFSVPGYNTAQEVRLLETRVLPWEPDLLLWHYDHNDAQPILARGQALQLPPEYGDNALHSAVLKVLRRAWERRRREPEVIDREAHEVHRGYLTAGPLYERHLELLERMAALTRERSIPVIVVLFDGFLEPPHEEDVHFEKLHRPLVQFLQSQGLEVLDLYPRACRRMQEEGRENLQHWWTSKEPLDLHPNPVGHAFLAEVVVDYLNTAPEPVRAALGL